MANPFPNRFRSRCNECYEQGDDTYAINGAFMCYCADMSDNVCECGNFKREEYGTCYECHELANETF